jgi:hypothetical protein
MQLRGKNPLRPRHIGVQDQARYWKLGIQPKNEALTKKKAQRQNEELSSTKFAIMLIWWYISHHATMVPRFKEKKNGSSTGAHDSLRKKCFKKEA